MPSEPYAPSINEQEIKQFESVSEHWWDEEGPFKPLHQITPYRIRFIRETLEKTLKLDTTNSMPLKGLKILDIGCGGGLLCEPLARLGAEVTGLDPSFKNIETARKHSTEKKLNCTYFDQTIESFTGKEEAFDVVLCMDVIEHVNDPASFLDHCIKPLKKGGFFFLSTLNKTLKAYLLGIVAAEYVLQMVPRGTHDWDKFIAPADVGMMLQEKGVSPFLTRGLHYNPLSGEWSIGGDRDVNYFLAAQKT